ncbi:hypothetical protein LX36DRAFT_60652 [Colletotrichum falcatum]|nr:hypothetical protein LX36DRAFT_60652 [Colletotrichum falcatum]
MPFLSSDCSLPVVAVIVVVGSKVRTKVEKPKVAHLLHPFLLLLFLPSFLPSSFDWVDLVGPLPPGPEAVAMGPRTRAIDLPCLLACLPTVGHLSACLLAGCRPRLHWNCIFNGTSPSLIVDLV